MKLRFNRQEMVDALSALSVVASPRTTKDILKCVRLDAQSDVLLLSATDLDLSLRCALTQVEVDTTGDTLVTADTLGKIVRECTDEILSLEFVKNLLHIRGEGSHFQIVTQDVSEFPAIPEMPTELDLTIDQAALLRMVELTTFAAARESTRYAINGVLWECSDGKITLSATDGRRLAVAHGTVDGAKKSETIRSIVPAKAMALLSRLSGEPDARVGIKLTSNLLILNLGRAMLSTSLVEGQFPNYRDVIPKDCDRSVRLNTAEFQSALKRAALLTNEESKGVRFAFADGTLTLSSRAPEQGEAEISLSVKYDNDPLEIGFNPAFLIDVLRVAHEEELDFDFRDADRPGVVRLGDAFIYVVMPVSLTSA